MTPRFAPLWGSFVVFAILSVPAVAAEPAAGVERAGRAPRWQGSFEVTPWAGTAGFAGRVGPDTTLGLKLGFGVDVIAVPFAGRHFTADWGLAYQSRDGATNKRLLKIGEFAIFARRFLTRGFTVEPGFLVAVALHKDSSDDDSSGAEFVGGYGAIFWGGRIVSVGARVALGNLHESSSGASELAVVVNPIILKLTTP